VNGAFYHPRIGNIWKTQKRIRRKNHPQSVREREEAIRQRLTDSVLDLAYLYDRLPSNLRADVFAPGAPRARELDDATTDAFAFVYSVMREVLGPARRVNRA